MRSSSLLLPCLALVAACAPASDPAGLVVDEASLLDESQRARVALFHGLLLDDYDIDYRVATVRHAGDIDYFAASRFAEIGAGSASDGGHGLLLVIDPAQDRVRLEVGHALEGTFPDAFIAYIEQRQMVPFFEADRVAAGILATTELIVARADEAQANAGLASEIGLAGSGGAGASTAARLGAGSNRSFPDRTVAAGARPEATLERYFAAMQARNANPKLDIYTSETQRMLEDWVTTPAQMDNIVRSYRDCRAEAAKIHPNGRLAVIRYPIPERQCSPWFFERAGRDWKLDLTMLQLAIRFGRDNTWHFAAGVYHPYEFAFDDWRIDSVGYPRERR